MKITGKKIIVLALLTTLTGNTVVAANDSDGKKTSDKEYSLVSPPVFYTKRAIAEYAFKALVTRNSQALINTFAPETIRQGIEIFGSRENLETACQEYLDLIPDKYISQRRRNKRVTVRMLTRDKDLIQINGNWYSTHNFDQISVVYTVSRLLDAVLARDTETIWLLLNAESQKRMMIESYGNRQTINSNLAKLCKDFIKDSDVEKIKTDKRSFLFNLLQGIMLSPRQFLTNVEGKYFVDASLFTE